MRVGEICCRHVVIIGKQDSIYTAAGFMRNHHVSEVVVVESCNGVNVPLGVLTDRDIVLDVIAAGRDLDVVTIGEIVNYQLLTANENDEVMATLKRMRHKGIRRMPVVSQDCGLCGILSIDNILDTLTEQLNDIDRIMSHEQCRGRQGQYTTNSS